MNKLFTLSAASLLLIGGKVSAQTILSEDFESGLPSTWTQTTLATDGGWNAGTAASLSSTSLPIPTTNSTNIVATNDDDCNCNKSADRLISPSMDLSGQTNVFLSTDIFFPEGTYQGATEIGTIEISIDGGSTWTVLETLSGEVDWYSNGMDISTYAGNSDVKISYKYNDDGGWLFGYAIDNFIVYVPQPDDAVLTSVSLPRYGLVNSNTTLQVTVKNNGSNAITSATVNWNDGMDHSSAISCNIAPGASATLSHPTALSYATAVEENITVSIDLVNGNADPNMGNNNGSALFNTVSTAIEKAVVIEEGTGTWCGWCPRGAVSMDYMTSTYPDDFIGIAVHNGDPMTVTAYDNGANFSGFPGCNVDRALLDQTVSQAAFEAYYMDRTDMMVPVGIDAMISGTGSSVTIDATATFATIFSSGDFRIAAVITEDHVTGTSSGYNQTNYYANNANGPMGGFESLPSPVPAADMEYNHVGRALLGGYAGQSGSIASSITDGQAFSHTFNYTVPSTSNRNNMHVVVMVLDNSTGEIVNAKQFPIGEPAGVSELANGNFTLYPNPANDQLNVSFDAQSESYEMQVIDLQGRVLKTISVNGNKGQQTVAIELNGMAAGNYLLTISNGSATTTKHFSVK